MGKPWLAWLGGGAIGLALGLVGYATVDHWHLLANDFFALKLKDFFGVATSLVIALLISRYVNSRTRSEALLHGVVGEVLDNASKGLDDALAAWERYIGTGTEEKDEERRRDLEAEILRNLSRVALSFQDLRALEGKKVVKSGVIDHMKLRKEAQDLKRHMTDAPFASKLVGQLFDAERVKVTCNAQAALKRRLLKLRIDLLR